MGQRGPTEHWGGGAGAGGAQLGLRGLGTHHPLAFHTLKTRTDQSLIHSPTNLQIPGLPATKEALSCFWVSKSFRAGPTPRLLPAEGPSALRPQSKAVGLPGFGAAGKGEGNGWGWGHSPGGAYTGKEQAGALPGPSVSLVTEGRKGDWKGNRPPGGEGPKPAPMAAPAGLSAPGSHQGRSRNRG